jgi:hypothetical protein
MGSFTPPLAMGPRTEKLIKSASTNTVYLYSIRTSRRSVNLRDGKSTDGQRLKPDVSWDKSEAVFAVFAAMPRCVC